MIFEWHETKGDALAAIEASKMKENFAPQTVAYFPDRDTAIAKWDARPEDPLLKQMVDELREHHSGRQVVCSACRAIALYDARQKEKRNG